MKWTALLMIALAALGCDDGDDKGAVDMMVDAPDADPMPEPMPEPQPDPMPEPEPDSINLAGAECAAGELVLGDPSQGDCVLSERVEDGDLRYRKLQVRADCADPGATALLSKRHLVHIPAEVTRDVLWLHLGGSGGQPSNTQNLGKAAVSAGYRYISLAYPNEPSIASRCFCDGVGPRPLDCEDRVRYEILYGDDVTPMFNMNPSDAIAPRLVALLTALHTERPDEGWDGFLIDGAINFERLAVSGFSQGGGMAGMIARDHAVDRTMYLSKGAGGAPTVMVMPETLQRCAANEDCENGLCCPLSEPDCTVPGDDAICLSTVPVPSAFGGRDVDGDGGADGDVTTRTTAGTRQFALIHRDEGAWEYSPEIFAEWGMGDRDSIVDVDSVMPPYTTQIWSTGRTPRNNCSEHQSMGADACQPRGDDGRPAVWPAWLHIMTVDLP